MNGLYSIVVFVALLSESYPIGWIISMDHIVSDWLAGLDWIVSYHIGWITTHRILCIGWLLLGWGDGTDGLFGALAQQGWDAQTLVPAGTGATEQERHHWHLRGSDALDGHCQHGTDGTDGLDGALVGRGGTDKS